MRVCDYEVEYGRGVFNCCADDVANDTSPAKEGMTIECAECGTRMVLAKSKNGQLKWRAAQ